MKQGNAHAGIRKQLFLSYAWFDDDSMMIR